jgi:pimeloyl-ACP methyl ester carboxylesterase
MTSSPTPPAKTTYADLAADSYGRPDDRPPIVLLHGLTFDRRMWRPALDELETIDPDRRAIALDTPGHGESPDATSYSVDAVVEAVRSAVVDAGLDAPVIVGHSGAAGTAGLYAARYPTRGVVSVEGSLMVAEFAAMLQSMRAALTGPGFTDVWARISQNVFGLDDVTPEVRAFVLETGRPRQDVVVGYWQDLLEWSSDELQAMVDASIREVRASGVPFVAVAGRDPSPKETIWMAANFPEARLLVWPGSGHFPQLAHPRRFAELLAGTATWSRPLASASTPR